MIATSHLGRRLVGLGAATLVAAGLGLAALGTGPAAAQPTPRQLVDNANGQVKAAQTRVDELFNARRQLDVEGTQLTADQRAVAARLEEARSEANKFVVSSYIAGAGSDIEESIVYQEPTTDVAYKSFFVKDRAKQVQDAVQDQRTAFAEVDAKMANYAIRRSDNATALERANAELEASLAALRDADTKLKAAEAAARAATTTTVGPSLLEPRPNPGGRLNAKGAGWEKLRQCESGGRYNVKSTYRGAYQFDYRTWASVGGSGDPADASAAEQDYRAQILFNQRGSQPWPVCGKSLNGDPDARSPAVSPF